MKTGFAVIGAGYGDEGKGLMTDYLVRKFQNESTWPINVRCNGGAQAGHTVDDGVKRHVFSHVPSGAFAGALMHLSSNFIVNPFALLQELNQLKKLNVVPYISVHPNCQVTSVFDMVINGLTELSRGENRHGSCGMGINETVTRQLAGYSLTVNDLFDKRAEEKISIIYNEWWTPKLQQFKKLTSNEAIELLSMLDIEQEIHSLITHTRSLINDISPSYRPKHSGEEVFIFEGAQGLELDEFLGVFPHVTRSITGLPSALLAAHEQGVSEITPVYVTRAYKTRHGAGPLPHESIGDDSDNDSLPNFNDKKIIDTTNVIGQWQGKFRYAPLDLHNLYSVIALDLKRSKIIAELLKIKINTPEIAVTCLDQMSDTFFIFDEQSKIKQVSTEELCNKISNHIYPVIYKSFGPSYSNIIEV